MYDALTGNILHRYVMRFTISNIAVVEVHHHYASVHSLQIDVKRRAIIRLFT